MQNGTPGLQCRIRAVDALSPGIPNNTAQAPTAITSSAVNGAKGTLRPRSTSLSAPQTTTHPEANEDEKGYENSGVFDTGIQSVMPGPISGDGGIG